MVYERNPPGEVAGCTIGRRDVLNVGWTYCWRDGARERPLPWAVNNVDGIATGWFFVLERRYLGINGPVRPGEDVDADKH